MGCDIHAHFEIKVDGVWLHWSQPNFDRDYQLFEKMAGVRGDISNAISPPKGFPSDASKTTRLHQEYWAADGHSHSWLGSDEIAALYEYHESIVKEGWKLDIEQWGYLFGNDWGSFKKYPKDYPLYIQDIRLVFWFDN